MFFFKSISHCLTVLFGASLLLASCTLTTEQETKLNADMNLLIKVRNEGDALSYLNLTHPLIVKHYKEKGDAVFKSKFQEMPRQKDQDKDKTEDRKSTRLNSSHVRISYAVFCLKKKNPENRAGDHEFPQILHKSIPRRDPCFLRRKPIPSAPQH